MKADRKVVRLYGYCRVLTDASDQAASPSDWVNLADPPWGQAVHAAETVPPLAPAFGPGYRVIGDKLILLDFPTASIPAPAA